MILARSGSQARPAAPAKERAEEGFNLDQLMAMISILYLLLVLVLSFWLLFDTWIGQHSIAFLLGYNREPLNTPEYRMVVYSVLGGAIGGVLNGIRSFLTHYHKFKWRYIWKYVTFPWTGSVLGLIVHTLVHSSISIVGGGTGASLGATQALSNFGIGALAGYGARDVLIWLDGKVNDLFNQIDNTPDVEGLPKDVAVSQLHASAQEVGEVVTRNGQPGKPQGTVVQQIPAPGSPIERGQPVDIIIDDKIRAKENDSAKVG